MTIKMPENFLWGTSTAAYQVEGSARADGRGLSIWDTFSHTPGKIRNGDTGDVATDHYRRWKDDVALMAALGVGAYRFSIAWPRVLPDGTGRVNEQGMAFYEALVDELLAQNITPCVTLYHWDLPQALEDRGGWLNRDMAGYFVEYADVMTRRLGDRVRRWMTLNEPNVFGFSGYFTGRHAPGHQRDTVQDALQAIHHALLAHGRAVDVIHSNSPESLAGIALSLGQAYPLSDTEEDLRAARLCDGSHNRWFADPLFAKGYPDDMLSWYGENSPQIAAGDMEQIAAPLDFLGVNAYCPDHVWADPDSPFGYAALTGKNDELAARGIPSSPLGWPILPESLKELLIRINMEYAPSAIYVTENGMADIHAAKDDAIEDTGRVDYLKRHIAAVLEAVEEGVPVQGYFVWSFMDNFEWAVGYAVRFGIVYIDYEDGQARIPKASFSWYQQFLKSAQKRSS